MTTVLITGANRGIGLELARQYAADGATVIGCCRKPDSASDLKALGAQVEQLDVASTESVKALKDRLGDLPIDILINNAGVGGGDRQSFSDMDYEGWADCLNINTMGPFRMISTFARNVGASDEKKIITISSFMGSIGRKGQGAYVYRSSKAAVNMVATLAGTQLAQYGVISVPMHPGWVRTDMGGSDASLSVKESASGIRSVIAGLTLEKSAHFWNYDGEELPW